MYLIRLLYKMPAGGTKKGRLWPRIKNLLGTRPLPPWKRARFNICTKRIVKAPYACENALRLIKAPSATENKKGAALAPPG